MDSVGRTATTAVCVACTTITGDHLNAGVGLQPGCEAVRLTVGQQVNDGTTFQVNEDRAVTLATLPGPVIHPEHARRRGGRRSGLTTDEAEQGRTAHGRADPLDQACASLAAQREADVVLQITQARRPLRIWPSSNRQALGKDAVRAAGSPAPQPAHLHLDLHVATLPGQVCQPAKIAAVQP